MKYVGLGQSGLKVSRIALGLVGASKPWQIEQAVQALDVTLGPQELAALAAPYQPHPVLGHQ